MRQIEAFLVRVLERLLWESRLILVLAVVASIIASTVLVLLGTYDIALLVVKLFKAAFHIEGNLEYLYKVSIIRIIGAVDSYLIATVLLIFGLGLYELFISKIEHIEKDTKSSKILMIHSLDQLKDKVAKVIVMVLIVTFFKYSISHESWNMTNLLMLALGILLVAVALFFLNLKRNTEH